MTLALTVSDHAVVRYLERVAGLAVPRPSRERRTLAEKFAIAGISPDEARRVRQTILAAVYRSGAPLDWPDALAVVTECFQVVIKNGTVVTVKALGAGHRRGTNVFCGADAWAEPASGRTGQPERPQSEASP